MPAGRLDDEDDELLDDALHAGLLPAGQLQSSSGDAGACSRPLCFGALIIGVLAFGVSRSSCLLCLSRNARPRRPAPAFIRTAHIALARTEQGSAVLATRIYDEKHAGVNSGACKNQSCSLIFVAGGCISCDDSPHGEQYHATLNQLEAYDPITATWNTSYPPMPTPRALLGLGALDDVLYAIGGTQGGNATGPCPSAAGKPCAEPPYPSGAVETFDPEKRKWAKGRPLSFPRWGLAVAASDGAIYAIGGEAANPKGATNIWPDGFGRVGTTLGREAYAVPTTVVEVLNPAESDGWTRRTNMDFTRAFAASAVLPYDQQGVVYVTGGRNDTSQSMASMAAYFPGNNSWVEKAPMPVARASHSSVVVSGKLYVLGGRTVGADNRRTLLRSVDEYDPRLNKWNTNVAAIPVRLATCCLLLSNKSTCINLPLICKLLLQVAGPDGKPSGVSTNAIPTTT